MKTETGGHVPRAVPEKADLPREADKVAAQRGQDKRRCCSGPQSDGHQDGIICMRGLFGEHPMKDEGETAEG